MDKRKSSNKEKKKPKLYKKEKKEKQNELDVIEGFRDQYAKIDTNNIKSFTDLPLSKETLLGLKKSGYVKLTDIQRESIPLALQGKDILGAAKTGSGKTLAFLIPILEALYCKQWTSLDGLGALIITPTRELAYQIFETLRKIGEAHDFSAGLVIGGKDSEFEKNRMDRCNIVICTPGRLLQHMDENPLFDCNNLKILVLDEADRCLDMGFEKAINAIVGNLPPQRQTLLFSATQTKSMKDLIRLSLKDPNYISVHENAKYSTPSELVQKYMICNLEDKISVLWSFIKNHLKKKTIIFFSTCKQAKYLYDTFCKLRPGISLLALHGKMHQLKRMEIYDSFCRKQSAVLFATDLVSRGLDFPSVHWVVQADCPEDPETYIHRVGRTARFQNAGESVLLLMPSEISMVNKLKEKKIPLEEIEVNPKKLQNPLAKLSAFIANDNSLYECARRSFISYIKNVYIMKDKEVFNVDKLNLEAYAKSLGLTQAPRVRYIQRMNAKYGQCNIKRDKTELKDEKNTNSKIILKADDGAEPMVTSDIFDIRGVWSEVDEVSSKQVKNQVKIKQKTKASVVKKLLNKGVSNKKIAFNDDGEAIEEKSQSNLYEKQSKMDNDIKIKNEKEEFELKEESGGIDIEKCRQMLQEEDELDKQIFRERIRKKHKEEKKIKQELKRNHDDFSDESDEDDGEAELSSDFDIKNNDSTSDDDTFSEEKQIILKEEMDSNKLYKSQKIEKGFEVNSQNKANAKRKIDNRENGKSKNKKLKKEAQQKSSNNIENLSDTWEINETEELAMLLLQRK